MVSLARIVHSSITGSVDRILHMFVHMMKPSLLTPAPQLSNRTIARHPGAITAPLPSCMQLLACLAVVICTALGQSQAQSPTEVEAQAAPAIVIGFVGGFVHSDDTRHSEVQLIQQLQANYGNTVRARVFENRQRKQARKFILDSIAASTGHKQSENDKARTRIILFGHSWGASSVIYLARDLQRDGLPVLLTVQVDSIRKHGEDDSNIPSNVSEAANFYQTAGILHGRSKITAFDPSQTTILGNFQYQYAREPAACREYPWYNRLLFKGHTAIECDPHVWSQIAELIRMQLPQSEVKLAAVR